MLHGLSCADDADAAQLALELAADEGGLGRRRHLLQQRGRNEQSGGAQGVSGSDSASGLQSDSTGAITAIASCSSERQERAWFTDDRARRQCGERKLDQRS